MGIALGSATVITGSVGGAIALTQGRAYVQNHLIPQISEDLSQSLNRPVELGAVESLSLTGIRLGESAIPATDADADSVIIKAVDIRFDLIRALRSKTVELDVTLIKPQIFLDQNSSGDWIETEVQLQDDELITVKHLRIRDGAIALAPNLSTLNGDGVLHQEAEVNLPTQFEFHNLYTHITLAQETEQIDLRARGKSSLGGRFHLNGSLTLAEETKPELNLTVETHRLSVLSLNLALPPSARLIDGQMTSRLQVHFKPTEASRNEPVVDGSVSLQQVAAWVEGEPNPFTETDGQFRIQNREIVLTNGFTRYGAILFQVQGQIHLDEGLNLDAQVASVSVPDFMDTFNFTLPFAATGALTTDNLRVTGPLSHAVFSGTVSNAIPVELDRLTLNQVQTDFSFDTESDRLLLRDTQVLPAVGGVLNAEADIQLDDGDNDEVELAVEAEALPADAIAALYDLGLPANALGEIQVAATIQVKEQQPTVNLNWQSRDGEYPTSGTVLLNGDRMELQQAMVQVAQHPIQVSGVLDQRQWALDLNTSAMPLSLVTANVSPGLDGKVDGQITIQGSTDAFRLNGLTAEGSAQLRLDSGQINVEAIADEGRWHTQIQSEELAIAPFLTAAAQQDIPPLDGTIAGNVTLAGNFETPSPADIIAEGALQISDVRAINGQRLFSKPIDTAFEWQGDRLQIIQATTDGLGLSGWIAADLSDLSAPSLSELRLNLRLENYDLASVSAFLPQDVQLAGRTTFNGSVSGTISNPALQGDLQLRELAINGLAFEPLLSGTMLADLAQGTRLNISGAQDAIAIRLDADWQPSSFEVKLDDAIATGQFTTPHLLDATIREMPLEHLVALGSSHLQSPVLAQLSGQLSANVSADLTNVDDPALTARFAIAQPRLQQRDGSLSQLTGARHEGDRFTGTLTYEEGAVSLTDSDVWIGRSHAQLQLETGFDEASSTRAELTVRQGNLQDVAVLIQELALLSDSDAAFEEVALLPLDVAALQGTFEGNLRLQALPGQSSTVQLSMQGRNWSIDNIGIQNLSLQNARLTTDQLKLADVDLSNFALDQLQLSGLMYEFPNGDRHRFDTHLTASRAEDGQWTGTLQAVDISLLQLADALGLPLNVGGNIDAIASLSGHHSTPHVLGTLGLDNVRLSTLTLDDVDFSISHQQGRFAIDDWTIDKWASLLPNLEDRTGAPPNFTTVVASAYEGRSPEQVNKSTAQLTVLSTIANSPRPGWTSNTKQVVLIYGPLRPSFSVADIATFAETGIVPSSWQFYLDLSGVEPDVLRQGLTQSVQIDVELADRMLNSTLGHQLLDQLGQMLHPPSRHASAEALRAALVLAASDDQHISLLEFFQLYPAQELHIEVQQLINLIENLERDRTSPQG